VPESAAFSRGDHRFASVNAGHAPTAVWNNASLTGSLRSARHQFPAKSVKVSSGVSLPSPWIPLIHAAPGMIHPNWPGLPVSFSSETLAVARGAKVRIRLSDHA